MQTMYPGMPNSPQTELAQAIDDQTTTIPLVDASKLPPAPNLAVIGVGENAETVLYTGKNGNDLTGVTRGFQGAAKAWVQGTKVARNFTAYDYDALRQNVADHIAALVSDPGGVHGLRVETGMWTPELRFGGSTAGITYAFRMGQYTRIANVVYWGFEIQLSSKGSASGPAWITGLPFNRDISLNFYHDHAVGRAGNISVPSGQWLSSYIVLTGIYLITNAGSSITSEEFANNSLIRASGFYFI